MPNVNINLRTLSLEEIKELKSVYSYPLYEQVLSGIISGHENAILKKRFFSDIIPKHENELEYQKSLLENLMCDIERNNAQIDIKQEAVSKKEIEKEQAYESYLKAEKEYRNALLEVEKAIQTYNSLKKAYKIAERRMKETNTVVLVHRTANINLLKKYNYGEIVMTHTDSQFLREVFTPDIVFDKNLANGLMLTKYENQLNLLTESNRKSLVEYIEMIIYYYLNEKSFVLVYTDKDISNLLRSEGLED